MSYYIPKYYPFIFNRSLAQIHRRQFHTCSTKNYRTQLRKLSLHKQLATKIAHFIEIASATPMDLTTLDYFDTLIIGEDDLLNLLLAFKLAMLNKRTLIIAQPVNPDCTLSKTLIRESLNQLVSSTICMVICKLFAIHDATDTQQLISTLYSPTHYKSMNISHDSMPMVSLRQQFDLLYGDNGNYLFPRGSVEFNGLPLYDLPEVTKYCPRPEQYSPTGLFYYNTVVKFGQIISTTSYNSEREHRGISAIRVGEALTPLKTFTTFTIVDRLNQIVQALNTMELLV